MNNLKKTILIIGAGPAGLTAGLLLARAGQKVVIYESDPIDVGGLAKTIEHNGFRFDIGGHRFFSKAPEVTKFWREILKDDFMLRRRLSRIYWRGKFLSYPLKPFEIVLKISPIQSIKFFLSYVCSKLFIHKKVRSFEDWVISAFGKELYLSFFKSYTEKVWGRPCSEISSDWADQRINNLNFFTLIISFFKLFGKGHVKSLIEEFEYPKFGPGMLWEKCRDEIVSLGGEVILNSRVQRAEQFENGKWRLELAGNNLSPEADELISTAPIAEIFKTMLPKLSEKVISSLSDFKYRDFMTIALMFKSSDSIPDNWIYVHNDKVRVARIQNYKRWSEYMVPGDEYVCYGLEYFCYEGDDLWQMEDEKIFQMAKEELKELEVSFSEEELSYKVIRVPKAYPVYDPDYKQRIENLKLELTQYSGLHLIGRNGMHRYNNQDHSIKTAMLVAENILKGNSKHDPWQVNQDAEYHERYSEDK